MYKEPLIDFAHLPEDLQAAGSGAEFTPLSEAERNEAGTFRLVLERCPDNRDEAACALSMSRTTLWRKMKKYGMLDE